MTMGMLRAGRAGFCAAGVTDGEAGEVHDVNGADERAESPDLRRERARIGGEPGEQHRVRGSRAPGGDAQLVAVALDDPHVHLRYHDAGRVPALPDPNGGPSASV